MVRFVMKLIGKFWGKVEQPVPVVPAPVTDGPSESESWKLQFWGQNKYEFLFCMELEVHKKLVLGLPLPKKIGLAHRKKHL